MGSRRKGRILAFQALFSWDAHRVPVDELLDFAWLEEERREKFGDDVIAFAALLVSGTVENIDSLDDTIQKHTKNWDLERIAKVDLAILRSSAYALVYQPEIPYSVTINEAVEISKKYGGNDSYKFINGVLDGIVGDLGKV